MGMFNLIHVKCPKCKSIVEFQTKSGSCIMRTFDIENVPRGELEGIFGDVEICTRCGTTVTVADPDVRIDGSRFVKRFYETR